MNAPALSTIFDSVFEAVDKDALLDGEMALVAMFRKNVKFFKHSAAAIDSYIELEEARRKKVAASRQNSFGVRTTLWRSDPNSLVRTPGGATTPIRIGRNPSSNSSNECRRAECRDRRRRAVAAPSPKPRRCGGDPARRGRRSRGVPGLLGWGRACRASPAAAPVATMTTAGPTTSMVGRVPDITH